MRLYDVPDKINNHFEVCFVFRKINVNKIRKKVSDGKICNYYRYFNVFI